MRLRIVWKTKERSITANCAGLQDPPTPLVVGKHRLDMVIENQVIIELKAVSGINDIHISLGFALSGSRFAAQTLSYMKATGLEIGLIINFGEESLVWKRLIKKAREAQAR